MRYRILLLLFIGSLATAEVMDVGTTADDSEPKGPAKAKDDVALAVIVHPDNSIKKISFSELRSYLKVRREFWPNKKRCELYLPPTNSPAYELLLKDIYRTSHKKLQKYWTSKQFSGEIATKPSHVSSFDAAAKVVLKREGAISVVPVNRVPQGARVLLIDNKKPGDPGYALSGKDEDKSDKQEEKADDE